MPIRFVAGTTVSFLRSFSEYPATDWDYTLYLRGPSILDVVGEVDGEAFNVTISAEESAELKAGIYRYVERVENEDGEIFEVGQGTVEVAADRSAAVAGAEQRSFARQMRDKIHAALLAFNSGSAAFTVQSFTIGNRQMVYRTHAELVTAMHYFDEAVRREEADERIAKGIGGDPNTIRTRFARA